MVWGTNIAGCIEPLRDSLSACLVTWSRIDQDSDMLNEAKCAFCEKKTPIVIPEFTGLEFGDRILFNKYDDKFMCVNCAMRVDRETRYKLLIKKFPDSANTWDWITYQKP